MIHLYQSWDIYVKESKSGYNRHLHADVDYSQQLRYGNMPGTLQMKLCCVQVNWMKLEGVMLSDVSQVQKDKGHMFCLKCRRSIQKDQHIHKNNTIIYTFIHRTCL
jgi:hypothetical protein